MFDLLGMTALFCVIGMDNVHLFSPVFVETVCIELVRLYHFGCR